MNYDQARAHLELHGWEPYGNLHSAGPWLGAARGSGADTIAVYVYHNKDGVVHTISGFPMYVSDQVQWDYLQGWELQFAAFIIKEGL